MIHLGSRPPLQNHLGSQPSGTEMSPVSRCQRGETYDALISVPDSISNFWEPRWKNGFDRAAQNHLGSQKPFTRVGTEMSPEPKRKA